MAQGYGGKCKTWYLSNKEKMQLHPETRAWVEENVSDNFLVPVRGAEINLTDRP